MYNEIFGNKVSRFSAWKAGLAYKMCKRIFGEQKESLDLVAVAKGGVYKDFKALTLVRRDDLEAQKDDDGTPAISVSAGVSLCSKKGSIQEMFHEADIALYHVKDNGRKGGCFYEDRMEEKRRKPARG